MRIAVGYVSHCGYSRKTEGAEIVVKKSEILDFSVKNLNNHTMRRFCTSN